MGSDFENVLSEQLLEGRYRILRRIAVGGMSTVWAAEHTLIGRTVAIKVLHPQYAADAECVQRFLAEGRTAGTLGHPNIVESTDMGYTANGTPFLVLELLEGSSLDELIRRAGPLPIDRAMAIARQIASALEAAHARGIVHRDLKSGNVFLVDRGPDGELVKVLDFGISKFLEGQSLTQKGNFLGTPWFMSPEQISDPALVDARSDVYGLGVILYEMLAGSVPFADSPFPAVIDKIVREEPPALETVRLEVGPALAGIVRRAMAKDRDERIQSMAEIGHALAALSGSAPMHRPPRAPSTAGLPEIEALAASAAAPAVELPGPGEAGAAAGGGARGVARAGAARSSTERPPTERPPTERPPTERPPTAGPRRGRGRILVGVVIAAAAGGLGIALAARAGMFAGGREDVADESSSTGSAGLGDTSRAAGAPGPGAGEAGLPESPAPTAATASPDAAAAAAGVPGSAAGAAGAPGAAGSPGAAGAPGSPAAASVWLSVESPTPGAHARVRGKTHRLPFREELAAAGHPEPIEVSAPGHETRRVPVTLDRDRALTIELAATRAADAHAAAETPGEPGLGGTDRGGTDRGAADHAATPPSTAGPHPQPAAPSPARPPAAEPAPRGEAGASPPRPAEPRGPAPGTMDREATRLAVKGRLREVETCFLRGRMDNPRLAGRVVVRIDVAPSGKVTAAQIASSTLAAHAVESCIVAAVRGWTLPAPAGGVAATITYPFVFQ